MNSNTQSVSLSCYFTIQVCNKIVIYVLTSLQASFWCKLVSHTSSNSSPYPLNVHMKSKHNKCLVNLLHALLLQKHLLLNNNTLAGSILSSSYLQNQQTCMKVALSSPFTDDVTEPKRGEVICPRSPC